MKSAELDVPPSAGTGLAARAWNVLGTRKALIWSAVVVTAYRFWLYMEVGRYSDIRGDERFYWRSSGVMLRAIGLDRADIGPHEFFENIVSRGWFLPGMSLVLTPARLFSRDELVGRAWIGILTLAVLFLVVRRIDQMFSRHVAVFTLLVVGILPYTAWFAFTFWGGHLGGLMMVLNLLWTIRLTRVIRAGEDPPWRQFLLLGVNVAFTVYVRPTTLGQVLPIAALLFFAYASRETFWPALRKSVLRWGAMWMVFMLLFAPWSIALMIKFDGPFFVVTSRPLGAVIRDASPADIERVGDGFAQWYSEIERLMRERNQGFYDVVTDERDRVHRDRSTTERLRRVSQGMRRFYDAENQFLTSALVSAADDESNSISRGSAIRLRERMLRLNSFMWTILTVSMLYVLLRRWAFWQSDGWLGIVTRGSMAMALFQPLTGGPHGRHINFLVPLFALSVALAIDSQVRTGVDDIPTIRWPWVERWAANGFSLLILAFLAIYFTY